MKKIVISVAVAVTMSVCADMTWEAPAHRVEGKTLILIAGKGPAKLRNVPVAPGKRYRLHYTAEGIGESGSTALFHNLQIVTDPRTEGAFMIQDVRNRPQRLFQNFRVPAKVRYNKVSVLFELKTRKGEVKISDVSLEEVAEDPRDSWFAEVVNPFYRRTFYAGDRERTIRFRMGGGAVWHDSELLNDKKVCVAACKGPVKPDGSVYELDASALPCGEYELKVLLTGKNGVQKMVGSTVTIAPKAKMEVIAGADRYFRINGEPIFPVFYFFEMVEDGLLYEASRNGVNMCIMGFNAEQHMIRELDRFHKYGIKGIIYLEQYGHIKDPARFDEFKRDYKTRVTQRILDHPAFFGYLLSDEPLWNGLPLQRVREYYEFVKSADPHHPIWINGAPRNEIPDLRMYAEYADVYGVDIYPIPYPNGHSNLPNKFPSVVGDYTRRFSEVVRGKKPVWMCLQGNSWSDYGFPKVLYRYPTYEESRFMAFDAMTSGAQGYLLYSPEHNKDWAFQQDLFKVSAELQSLSGLFIRAEKLPDAVSSAPEIRCALYRYEGKVYGILVNTSVKPVSGSVELPAGAVMKVVGSGKVLDPAKLSLAPLEVAVWGDAPLPPPCWKPIPENPEFEGKSAFRRSIERRRARREEEWKKRGITPVPAKPQQ